ncbi:MAG: tetratricopeptide repeat protein [Patescibacteria group bacterium]
MERVVDIKYFAWDAQVLLGWGCLLVVLGLAIWRFKQNSLAAFGLLWLGIALAPASGVVVPVSGLMYEHYIYLPILGLAVFGLSLFYELIKKLSNCLKIILFGLVVVWLGWLGLTTINRNAIWRRPTVFYEDVLKYNKQSLRIWNNYGMALSDQERYDEAAEAYQQAIILNKDNLSAPPYHNLANALLKLGRVEEAINNYQQAIAIDSQFYYSYNSLAAWYLQNKDFDLAKKILEQGIMALPDNQLFKYNLRVVEEMEKRERAGSQK